MLFQLSQRPKSLPPPPAGLVFDPLQKHEGYSYYDVMLQPLAEALGRARKRANTQIWFALQGAPLLHTACAALVQHLPVFCLICPAFELFFNIQRDYCRFVCSDLQERCQQL